MRKLYLLLATVTVALTSWAQTTVGWNFGTGTTPNALPSSGTPVSNLAIGPVTQGNNNGTTTLLSTTSASTGYAGASGSYNAGAAARTGALVTGTNGSAYFEVVFTPDAGYTVNVSNIAFGSRSTGTGPVAYSIRTNIDNYAGDAGSGTLVNNSNWALNTKTVSLSSNSAPLTIRIYGYNGTGSAAANTANWRIDDLAITVTITGGGGDVTPPVVSSTSPANNATVNALSFGATINFNENVQKVSGTTGNVYVKELNTGNTVQTIPVAGAGVTVNNNAVSFTISGLAYSTAYYVEVDANTFADAAGNNFVGLTGNTGWRFTTYAQPAAGVLGFTYNFNTCGQYLAQGFSAYDVLGGQSWGCTAFGLTYPGTGISTDSAIQISGFSGSAVANEDWFISPKFDLTGTNVPLLKFYSRNAFAGNQLVLKVSTNYSGSGSPYAATWTDINGKFPPEALNVWTLSDSINLSAFKGANVYVAWVYTSTTAGASRWTLDDVTFYNGAAVPAPNITTNPQSYDFGIMAAGGNSFWRPFSFTSSDFSSGATLTAPAGFVIAKDSTTAGGAGIAYTQAEMNSGTKTFYVRFSPPTANRNYAGPVTATATGYTAGIVNVRGSSFLQAATLDLVNWNIEWFGSTASGQGPTNDSLAEANVKTIMRNLNADLYALSEVVDTARIKRVADSLGGNFGVAIADYASYATDLNDPDYAGAQKNGFIYNKNIFSNVTTRALLRYHATQQQNDSSFYYWSSGRYPYLLNADVTMNGTTKNINFIVVHGKANTGNAAEQIESYFRRKKGVLELKDTLDIAFANANVVLLGDFNDDLDRTIAPTTGEDTVSSYNILVSDSTDANSYRSVTLPLSRQGLRSTASNADVIDHVVISNEMAAFFIPGSASIRSDVANLVANYATTTSDHYPVLSRYYVSSSPGPLPIKLVSFTANKEGNAVKLSWETSQEVNTKEFWIERSADGARFEKLATVTARGNGSVAASYQTADAQPFGGNNFYRLRTVDVDGKTELSNVVRINFGKAFTVSLSPNPAKGQVTVSLAGTPQPIALQLINAAGKTVKTATLANGINRVVLEGLAKGVYWMRFNGLNESSVEKLIVQ